MAANTAYQTWRATDNALEAIAAIHNNAFLPLDEITEIDESTLQSGLALANGRQKERMQKTADLRTANTWRLLFMSTGEIGFAKKLSEDPPLRHGRPNRPLDRTERRRRPRHGHVRNAARLFRAQGTCAGARCRRARALRARRSRFYPLSDPGHGAPDRRRGGVVAKFIGQVCQPDADGRVARVAQRFGLIAAAGEMAIAAGIVPWTRGDASRACKRLFAEWVAARGTSGPIEIENGILQIRRIIERDGPRGSPPGTFPAISR